MAQERVLKANQPAPEARRKVATPAVRSGVRNLWNRKSKFTQPGGAIELDHRNQQRRLNNGLGLLLSDFYGHLLALSSLQQCLFLLTLNQLASSHFALHPQLREEILVAISIED